MKTLYMNLVTPISMSSIDEWLSFWETYKIWNVDDHKLINNKNKCKLLKRWDDYFVICLLDLKLSSALKHGVQYWAQVLTIWISNLPLRRCNVDSTIINRTVGLFDRRALAIVRTTKVDTFFPFVTKPVRIRPEAGPKASVTYHFLIDGNHRGINRTRDFFIRARSEIWWFHFGTLCFRHSLSTSKACGHWQPQKGRQPVDVSINNAQSAEAIWFLNECHFQIDSLICGVLSLWTLKNFCFLSNNIFFLEIRDIFLKIFCTVTIQIGKLVRFPFALPARELIRLFELFLML